MKKISKELKEIAESSINGSIRPNFGSGPSFLEHAYLECVNNETKLCQVSHREFMQVKVSEVKVMNAINE